MNDSRKCRWARTLSFAAALAIGLGLGQAARPDGSVAFAPEYENWLGILPSFGIGWKL